MPSRGSSLTDMYSPIHGILARFAGVVVVGLACSSGCAPLGLYSLGHSLLVHNHVLKPVLPDDESDSSLAESLPMESCRESADGRPKLSDASSGDEPCQKR